MEFLKNIRIVSSTSPSNKRVLLRVDFNVTISPNMKIVSDQRIIQAIPTIKLLLKNRNKIILISHLGRPNGRDAKLSLSNVAERLQVFISDYKIILIDDFQSELGEQKLKLQKDNEIIILENIRFYKEEQENNKIFAKKLSLLADAYVNDAFGVCHRSDASIVSIPLFIPSFCGLLLEKEITAISMLFKNRSHPITAIIGGAKISTKIKFLSKLTTIADKIILGGALANTFLLAKGFPVGNSLIEEGSIEDAKKIMSLAEKNNTKIILPIDALGIDNNEVKSFTITSIPINFAVLDIGPQSRLLFTDNISKANTIIWNGPVGKCEDSSFSQGTIAIYNAIANNNHCFSVIGGGDTLAAISDKKYHEKISHISTGGGALLAFIENSTLPGIDAIRQNL